MMAIMKRIVSLTVFLMFCCGTVAQAVSFPNVDCNNATTAMEQSICNNSQLKAIDSQLGESYKLLKIWFSPLQVNQMGQEQREWLQKRAAACSPGDVACLLARYEERVATLRSRYETSIDGIYEMLKSNLPLLESKQLEQDQNLWLTVRDACPSDDVACLLQLNEVRLATLSKLVAEFESESGKPYPPFNKKCEKAEIQHYAQGLAQSQFARSALRSCGAEAVPALIAVLENSTTSSDVRKAVVDTLKNIGKDAKVVDTLKNIGKDAKAAVPVLITLLETDANRAVRVAVADALGKIGEDANVVVPALIEALKKANEDQEWQVCSSIVTVLRGFKKDAKTAVPVLITLLEPDENKDVREAAARALGMIGEEAKVVVPPLIKLLESDTSSAVRAAAADALGAIGEEANIVIPALIEALKKATEAQESQVRHSAASALAKFGKEAVPPLVELLESDPSSDVRRAVADALGTIGEDANVVIPALIEALKKASEAQESQVRDSAASALAKFGKEAVPPLVELLESEPSSDVRQAAAEALRTIGKEAKAAVPLLIKLLESDTSSDVRQTAAEALGTIGAEANTALPALIDALKGQDDALASTVVRVFGRIGKDALAGLIEALKYDNADIRAQAAVELMRIGKDATPATEELQRALKDDNSLVRSRAAVVLSQINPDYPRLVIPELIAAIDDNDSEIQARAIAALAEIGAAASEAVPALIKECKRNEGAVFALGNIGQAAQAAVPTLLEVLKEDRGFPDTINRQVEAAQALGKIGADTKLAVPALIAALGDQNQAVRRSAYRTLEQFGVRLPALISQLIASLNVSRSFVVLRNDFDEHERRRAALALATIGQPAVPALLLALRDTRQIVRQGAAYALGQFEMAPGEEALTQLAAIVQDESNELEVRRVAASSLELLGQDMHAFFEKYHFVSPQHAGCSIRGGCGGPLYIFEFDVYTGRCVQVSLEHFDCRARPGGSLFHDLCSWFGGCQ